MKKVHSEQCFSITSAFHPYVLVTTSLYLLRCLKNIDQVKNNRTRHLVMKDAETHRSFQGHQLSSPEEVLYVDQNGLINFLIDNCKVIK